MNGKNKSIAEQTACLMRACKSLGGIALIFALSACTAAPLTPPQAQIGDAALTVTVRLQGQGRFPSGSQANITVADITTPSPQPLAGDRLTLGEADRSFRVTLPADKNKIRRCRKTGICGLFVTVTHLGQPLYSNKVPTPYNIKRSNITVAITADR